MISDRPVNPDVGSTSSFELAKAWLNDCLQGKDVHQQCLYKPSWPRRFRPARLLDVMSLPDPELVRLQETDSIETEWCALSYCWGGDQPCKLLNDRLEQYRRSINLRSLPRTLVDAVQVARKLGQKYLWIDALCIIQDDNEDKQWELAKMSDIYGSAVVTIVASSSASSETGFLHKREDWSEETTQLCGQSSDGHYGPLYLSTPGRHAESSEEPTSSRAWCLQERVLSPRVLDYGTYQLRWICCSCSFAQGAHRMSLSDTEGATSKMLEGATLTQESRVAARQRQWAWERIVSDYTRRQLTFTDDKLNALAAVAERYMYTYGLDSSGYTAGIWKEDLTWQLCWRNTAAPPRLSVQRYRAPTWSWAAIDDWVEFDQDEGGVRFFEVLKCTTDTKFAALPFGAVKGGCLTVRGRLLPAEWRHRRGKDPNGLRPYSSHSVVHLKNDDREFTFNMHASEFESDISQGRTPFLGWMYPDALDERETTEQNITENLWCMLARASSQRLGTLCFMFTSHNNGHSFQRRGVLEMGDQHYRFDEPIKPFKMDIFRDVPLSTIQVY